MIQLSLEQRILAFSELGIVLNELLSDSLHHPVAIQSKEQFDQTVSIAFHHNGWFDEQSVRQAIREITAWLTIDGLKQWVSAYPDLETTNSPKNIGVIMAGNLPLVGFHDMLSVLIGGHRFIGKTSSKDPVLPHLLIDIIIEIEPKLEPFIVLTSERFSSIDAVIATGSSNSTKYFDHYFSKYPNIIRGNRHSVAILSGRESTEELAELGNDIFTYYGLGCRNVTNLFVPKGYNFNSFFESIEPFGHVLQNKKYANNYEYNRTVYLLNKEDGLLDNNFIILKPGKQIGSPIGTLFYSEYESLDEALNYLAESEQNIQCVVGETGLSFGEAQRPKLIDYPDRIDLLNFVSTL